MERFVIAKALRKARKATGLTVAEVAGRLCWSKHMVYACENGWPVRTCNVMEYAELLGIDVDMVERGWNA